MTVFEKLFSEIILVSNHPTTYLEWDAMVVKDLYTTRSSLTGIHSGLFYTKTDHAFIAACDTPFLKMDLVKTIVQYVDPVLMLFSQEQNLGLNPCVLFIPGAVFKPFKMPWSGIILKYVIFSIS